jgi:DNA invertase Pin-like site-specific DNA recombinase
MPSANRLTLHILAVAEDEAHWISERAKAAMAIYKASGDKLGTVANLTREAGKGGAKTSRAKARIAYAGLLPRLREWRAAGMSFAIISTCLNETGQTTRSGCLWNPAQVRRALLPGPPRSTCLGRHLRHHHSVHAPDR